MAERKLIQCLDHSEEFYEPQVGRRVYPHQCCPMYRERKHAIMPIPECYFCECADFHLEKAVALEVGICCYPENVLQSRRGEIKF